ncbi:conserved hypothetical protein [Candidatus Sulfopaludibacter sp. SbA4]|nr:conserved hypothetical protein [Candidatus Sulfopaludibacter sp. SbA4]
MGIIKGIFYVLLPALAQAQFTQQGGKLVGTGAAKSLGTCTINNPSAAGPSLVGGGQGSWTSISADGNTMVSSALADPPHGAAWVFARSNGTWSQQGPKLVGSGYQGIESANEAVAISGDGNTFILGNNADNNPTGAVWFFTRSNGVWSQQGPKMVGTGATALTSPGCVAGQFNLCPGAANQGWSVAISADGNTAIEGGPSDANNGLTFAGAAWIFTRTNGVWSQQGNKLVGTGVDPYLPSLINAGAYQGNSVAISADGNTAVVGGNEDGAIGTGAVWIFTRSNGVWTQQGNKLVGTGAVGSLGAAQGSVVAISGDGNTMAESGPSDNFDSKSQTAQGAVWIFTRSNGVWTQQGSKLVRNNIAGKAPYIGGVALSLSLDGNTLIMGSGADNTAAGAAWVFTRSNGVWTQQPGKLVGTGAIDPAFQGSVALSADASTLAMGGPGDNNCVGATWVFAQPSPVPAPTSVTLAAGGGNTQTFTATFTDTGGWENFSVVDVLIRDVLDGRQACYVAFIPSGPNSGSVLLVDDGGDAGGPYSGMTLPGTGSVSNSQCSITGAGSLVSATGNSLTLTLPITFTPAFAGNKVAYLSAQDTGANSGWSALSTVSVAGAALTGPSVTGVTPVHTTGFTATDTFMFTDTNGFQDIAVANVLINGSIDGRHGCFLALVPISATSVSVLLVDDAGDAGGPYSGMVIPGNGSVSNSQCSITGALSLVNASGNNLSVTLPITFTQGFAGNQVVYLAARSNAANSGWQAVGTAAVH